MDTALKASGSIQFIKREMSKIDIYHVYIHVYIIECADASSTPCTLCMIHDDRLLQGLVWVDNWLTCFQWSHAFNTL